METYINNSPESAISVLELFSPTKQGIAAFTNQVANNVKDGYINPLRVALLCNTMKQAAESIRKAIKENEKTEAAKYGEREFEYFGAAMHYTATSTVYDYEATEDVILSDLELQLSFIQEKIKRRKELLKTLGEPTPMINPATGESYMAYPPIKKSEMGLKVTIK